MAPQQKPAGLERCCSLCHAQPSLETCHKSFGDIGLLVSHRGSRGSCSAAHSSTLQAEGRQAADSDAQRGIRTTTSVVSLSQMPWANIWVPVTALTVQAYETQLLTSLHSLALVVSVLGDREASRRLWLMSHIQILRLILLHMILKPMQNGLYSINTVQY